MSNKEARNPKNEQLAQAFEDIASYEFKHGGLNTGAGASYSKIAQAIREVDEEITSGEMAMQYRDIGAKSASMIDEYLEKGKISKPATKHVPGQDDRDDDEGNEPKHHHHSGHHSKHKGHGDEGSHHKSSHHAKAKNYKNQALADAFEDLAHYDRKIGDSNAGMSYSKVAEAIRDADIEVESGDHAMKHIPGVGKKSAAAINEFLATGKIEMNAPNKEPDQEEEGQGDDERQDVDDTSRYKGHKHMHATNPKNQDLVDAFEEYADREFERNTGKGAEYTKIAQAIRSADEEITSGQEAKEDVFNIGDKSAEKIDQFMDTGKIK
ncbi:hypothetical protein H310_10902 [Aphanomyces invadans]|uniref:Crossover junction endonuclease MUS81-like HHH domain-containing protein n=1 Tax=Aphanomyces invadans TaxID=157072 RepID=A0A024TPC7_9STRA|nr:hypothetical protein H310_10902 [Aphanomyces invadans]ETV95863.1 hypothetical protein H310_10902 [Aphanomyces invadans]|eukprot:XP_008875614.1 hypothetical protein H310_10902 [Aphanomyces invadans]